MKTTKLLFAVLSTLVAQNMMAGQLAGPVYNPANGHYYYLLTENTWTASNTEAGTLGGYLVTVNNAAENTFIYNTFSQYGGVNRGLWIGLNDKASEGNFVWSGPNTTYRNWGGNEPINQGGATDYVHIFWPGDGRQPGWNDQFDVAKAGSIPINGVVEVEEYENKIFINSVTQMEHDAGFTYVYFTVSLLDPASVPVSVAYATANGTATAPNDYTAKSGVVSFAVGQKSRTIRIRVKGNLVAEADEEFTVNLSNPVGGVISVGLGACTIVNDD